MENRAVVSYTKLTMSFFSLIAGIILLYLGLFLPPQGEIHTSVLVGFGETLTFSGAILGIHFSYSTKLSEIEKKLEEAKKAAEKQ